MSQSRKTFSLHLMLLLWSSSRAFVRPSSGATAAFRRLDQIRPNFLPRRTIIIPATPSSCIQQRLFASKSNAEPPSLPVGIFLDLDNINLTPTRKKVEAFVQPIRRTVQSFGGEIVTFQAFANRPTQTWTQHDGYEDELEWNADAFHTGYDDTGMLRCGVCGKRMKLSKKDMQKGRTEEDKLRQHMRQLHDREQRKRHTRDKELKKRIKKLPAKEVQKSQKYKSAQIGLSRMPGNDLFRILGEQKISCVSADNVDVKLTKKASQFLRKNKNGTVVLAVASEDSDFVPLLENARAAGAVAISISPHQTQTNRIKTTSDVVLSFDDNDGKLLWEALSEKGLGLQQNFSRMDATVGEEEEEGREGEESR